jgi:hypothetical protein
MASRRPQAHRTVIFQPWLSASPIVEIILLRRIGTEQEQEIGDCTGGGNARHSGPRRFTKARGLSAPGSRLGGDARWRDAD